MKFKDILDAIGHTPLVELPRLSPKKGVRIFAKLEGNNPTGSVKDRIALYMIRQAEENGNLTRDKTILEATSGNTGISLAMIGQRKGYRVKVVMPESVSPERVELLHLFGAEIVFSEGSGGTNRAIEVAQEMAAKDGQYFMPYQYGNEANPQAHYETTAPESIEDLPDIDAFVAGLGTGGTLMGVGRRLKEHDSNTRIVAVVPNPGDRIMGLRSLEEGFTPPIVDLGLLDSRIVVDSKQAFVATRELTKKEGLFAGISSGSVIVCAQRVAQRMEKGNIVALLADGGWKYLSTRLWTRAIEDMESDIDSLIWW